MDEVRITARLPKNIRDWIKQRAIKNNRSMNGELISLLNSVKNKEALQNG